jgi:hypothetical protein
MAVASELPPLPPSPPVALPLEVSPPMVTEVAEPALFVLSDAEASALPVDDFADPPEASALPLRACELPSVLDLMLPPLPPLL